MKTYKLRNGNEIPIIGYGTWKLKDNEETVGIIKEAIEVGYRHFDTAYAYGNEKSIGEAFSGVAIPREKLFVTGKLWNDDRGDVAAACERTIRNLKCEYLDLYLMHWPAAKAVHEDWAEINARVWSEMEKLYESGKVKAIGVCNFNVNQLKELEKTVEIMPMVDQVEFHIGQVQPEIRNYCEDNKILVEAWSPLGSGKMLKVEALQDMAKKYNVSTAQLCIKWCLNNNVLPLPKSKNPERMRQNLEVFDLVITDEDMEFLNKMPYVGGSGLDSETLTLFG